MFESTSSATFSQSQFLNQNGSLAQSSNQFKSDSSSNLKSAKNYYANAFNDDWSKESLECFFSPLESFLENQLKREHSSKKRCEKLVQMRNIEHYRAYIQNRLKEYDEKINLDLLVKNRKKLKQAERQQFNQLQSPSYTTTKTYDSASNTNFKALIADSLSKPYMKKYKLSDELTTHYSTTNSLRDLNKLNINLKLPKISPQSNLKNRVKDAESAELFYESSHYGNFESKTLNDFSENYFNKRSNMKSNRNRKSMNFDKYNNENYDLGGIALLPLINNENLINNNGTSTPNLYAIQSSRANVSRNVLIPSKTPMIVQRKNLKIKNLF
jgi:hypothetical protein